MTTTRKIRPINLRDFQSRHLQTHKRLLVVEPLREQPPEYVGSFHAGVFHTTVVRRGGTEEPGPAVFGAYSDDGEWSAVSPHQPGDVVPCRERWAREAGKENRTVLYEDGSWGSWSQDGQFYPHGFVVGAATHRRDGRWVGRGYFGPWQPARTMPDWAIRLHPVVESVECRRVGSITGKDVFDSGYPFSSDLDQFKQDWHRRHKRPCDAFDVAWGFFTLLRLER